MPSSWSVPSTRSIWWMCPSPLVQHVTITELGLGSKRR